MVILLATSTTGDYNVVNTFYDDTSLQINKLDWRTTHKLVVDFGEDGHYDPTSLDGGATGSSGSHGIITAVNNTDPDWRKYFWCCQVTKANCIIHRRFKCFWFDTRVCSK